MPKTLSEPDVNYIEDMIDFIKGNIIANELATALQQLKELKQFIINE